MRSLLSAAVTIMLALLLIWYLALPPDNYAVLNPRTTSVMEQRRSEAWEKREALNIKYSFVPLTEISPDLVSAVIASEDTYFCSHHGIDYGGMKDALAQAWKRGKFPRGASTISQQLVKNLYLSTHKSIVRKVREFVLTYQLEFKLSKRRIMELYLNVAEFGDGVFGAQAAAEHYFDTDANDLSASQAAFLAAILPAPDGAFDPGKFPKKVEEREELIRKRMAHSRVDCVERGR